MAGDLADGDAGRAPGRGLGALSFVTGACESQAPRGRRFPEERPCLRPATESGGMAQRYGEGATIRIGAALASLTISAKPVTPAA